MSSQRPFEWTLRGEGSDVPSSSAPARQISGDGQSRRLRLQRPENKMDFIRVPALAALSAAAVQVRLALKGYVRPVDAAALRIQPEEALVPDDVE